VPARLKYVDSGRVTTFRLDSGDFFTTWGRIFIDACIPSGTDLRIDCYAVDELPDGATMPRTPPANLGSMVILRPDLSPPMIPLSAVPATVQDPLYRRETGPETPWVRFAANDNFRTYEAPIQADPGRYLWVTVELTGNTRATPRLRSIRAEYPSHDYLRKLPKTFSRDPRAASFLLRYLAIFEGELGSYEALAITRRALIEAASSPEEVLPWLAAFIGLALDERWSEAVRRQLIAAGIWLFRFRGTIPGLLRFLEICTEGPADLVEKYRLRGSGEVILGDTLGTSSVIGVGFRLGGASIDDDPGAGGTSGTEDAFETHAHRFTVYIQQTLSQDQLDMVQHLLDVHRPAHTVVDICTVGAGMRVGRGLLVGLTSMIGKSGGFTRFQVGSSVLGRGALLGVREAGTVAGSSRVGRDTQVG
jgi:phage tail-like protein